MISKVLAFSFVAVVLMAVFVTRPAATQGGSGALVVVTCGTLPLAYTPGATRKLTVNTNGQVCQ